MKRFFGPLVLASGYFCGGINCHNIFRNTLFSFSTHSCIELGALHKFVYIVFCAVEYSVFYRLLQQIFCLDGDAHHTAVSCVHAVSRSNIKVNFFTIL